MKIYTYSEFICEGKYDKISGNFVDLIWEKIKESYLEWKSAYELRPSLKTMEEKNYILPVYVDNLKFQPKLSIKRKIDNNLSMGFEVDGFTDVIVYEIIDPEDIDQDEVGLEDIEIDTDEKDNTDEEEDDFENDEIEIVITINPKKEPECYPLLNAWLQDAARHEIEHLTQAGKNKKSNKPTPTSEEELDAISKKNSWKYFLLDDEVDAMIYGINRSAKTQKIPFDKAAIKYLDWRISVGDNIPKGKYTNIMKTWILRAKKLLTSVKLSDDIEKWLN